MPALDSGEFLAEFRMGRCNGGVEGDQVSFGGDDLPAQEFIRGR